MNFIFRKMFDRTKHENWFSVKQKAFSKNIPFSENAIFGKGKCIQVVWLPWNSFYGKSIPVFGLYKHFTENTFRFTKNQFPCLVQSNILRKMKFVFTKNQFPCLVCGSFYGKYEMPYNFKHLHYLNKPVIV